MAFQFGTDLLETCVLAILNIEDTYGYKLTQEIRKIVPVSESTLYPILRRLTNEQYLITYDKEYMGRNRRYYHLNETGKEKYRTNKGEWNIFHQKVTRLFEQGEI